MEQTNLCFDPLLKKTRKAVFTDLGADVKARATRAVESSPGTAL
jgi:hypothetical protein